MAVTRGYRVAQRAIKALDSSEFVEEPGMCKKFVRQVLEKEFGNEFSELMEGENADEVHDRLKRKGLTLPRETNLEPGDVLLWNGTGENRHGHIAVYIGDLRVAENSTRHYSKRRKGKGTASLSRLRPWQAVWRIPRSREV